MTRVDILILVALLLVLGTAYHDAKAEELQIISQKVANNDDCDEVEKPWKPQPIKPPVAV